MACVLVTGGAGFLGAAVVRRLAGRGDRVIALDNFQAGVPANLEGLGCNVAVFGGDVTDLGGLLGLIRQHRVQRIIHAAAIVSTLSSLSAPSHVTRVNIEGTLNVLEAMRLFDVERAVHISSEETYGAFRCESRPTKSTPRFYRTVYKTDFINVRTSWVYGPGFPRQRMPRAAE
jgi:nucleoside-diphosphate-sugar epimerase